MSGFTQSSYFVNGHENPYGFVNPVYVTNYSDFPVGPRGDTGPQGPIGYNGATSTTIVLYSGNPTITPTSVVFSNANDEVVTREFLNISVNGIYCQVQLTALNVSGSHYFIQFVDNTTNRIMYYDVYNQAGSNKFTLYTGEGSSVFTYSGFNTGDILVGYFNGVKLNTLINGVVQNSYTITPANPIQLDIVYLPTSGDTSSLNLPLIYYYPSGLPGSFSFTVPNNYVVYSNGSGATGNIDLQHKSNTGVLSVQEDLSYTSAYPIGIENAFSENTYTTAILGQNKNASDGSSVSILLTNDLGTDSKYYGGLSMYSSGTTPQSNQFASMPNALSVNNESASIVISPWNGQEDGTSEQNDNIFLTYNGGTNAHYINHYGNLVVGANNPSYSGTTYNGDDGATNKFLTSNGTSGLKWTSVADLKVLLGLPP
jgi:hypothetical protein